MLLCHLFIFHPQIRCLCPTLLFPSRGREKPGGTSRLWLHSWPPADRPNRNPLLPTTRLPLPITREPQRAVFQPPTHAHTHLPATHTLSHTRADSSRGGGAEERLQPANQGSAFQLALQRLLRSLSAPLLRWGGCFTCVSFSVINSRPFALRRVASGFFWFLTRSSYSYRAPSTMTCGGHVSISSWCGSMHSWCWWASCCPPVTATCFIARRLTSAAGRSWSTAHTVTHLNTCEWPSVCTLWCT